MEATRDERLQSIMQQRNKSLIKLISIIKKDFENKLMDKLRSQGYENFKVGNMGCLANVQLDGTINNELAKKAKITKQAMSKVVKNLETEGYIYTRKHETDNRASVIYLTDKGKDLTIAASECVQETQASYKNIIGEEDAEKLREILTKLVTGLDII